VARKQYGVPYQGSKSQIAEWIIENLPEADVLVDLFAGGCAITDCALQSGKWDKVIANDKEGSGIELFIDATQGKYKTESRWISRDFFNENKETDPYIKWIWSFGNDGESYLYSKEREMCLEPIWKMIFSDSTEEARRQWKEFCGRGRKNIPDRIQSLEGLERLKKIESLETSRIKKSREDYTKVIIPDNSVIYCDPPYKGVKGYSKSKFDYEAFYEWCTRQSVPVYISEYSMPEELFEVVAEKPKRNTQSSTKNLLRIEKIYKPRKIEVK
jgi:site-specific DNA-adenine methylase